MKKQPGRKATPLHAKTPKSKFPKYPSLAYDYGALESARTELRKPNRCICLYCRAQAVTEGAIRHDPDCPVPVSERVTTPLEEESYLCQKCGKVSTDQAGDWVEIGSELGRRLGCHGNVCPKCLASIKVKSPPDERQGLQVGDRVTVGEDSNKVYTIAKFYKAAEGVAVMLREGSKMTDQGYLLSSIHIAPQVSEEKREAIEAALTEHLTKLVPPKSSSLVHSDGRQFDFHPQPNGKVKIRALGIRCPYTTELSIEAAREKYVSLVKKGFRKW